MPAQRSRTGGVEETVHLTNGPVSLLLIGTHTSGASGAMLLAGDIFVIGAIMGKRRVKTLVWSATGSGFITTSADGFAFVFCRGAKPKRQQAGRLQLHHRDGGSHDPLACPACSRSQIHAAAGQAR